MGTKSRGNWRVELCLKECAMRGEMCMDCFHFSKYVPNKRIKTKECKKGVEEW